MVSSESGFPAHLLSVATSATQPRGKVEAGHLLRHARELASFFSYCFSSLYVSVIEIWTFRAGQGAFLSLHRLFR